MRSLENYSCDPLVIPTAPKLVRMTKKFTELNIYSKPRLGPILHPHGLPQLEALLDLLVEDGPDFPDVTDGAGLYPVFDLHSRGGVLEAHTVLPASMEVDRWRLGAVTEGGIHVRHDLIVLGVSWVRVLVVGVVTTSASSSHSVLLLLLRMLLRMLMVMLLVEIV